MKVKTVLKCDVGLGNSTDWLVINEYSNHFADSPAEPRDADEDDLKMFAHNHNGIFADYDANGPGGWEFVPTTLLSPEHCQLFGLTECAE